MLVFERWRSSARRVLVTCIYDDCGMESIVLCWNIVGGGSEENKRCLVERGTCLIKLIAKRVEEKIRTKVNSQHLRGRTVSRGTERH